ncbi:reverse transcriptase [Gossypium australe]|uniref:Reverse transcriptase n=1 Tax=Gossypium australe TaxID=47621 RepID=A0A5B6VW80_9ROSI|nr:reverse transcriptase [Gossypium australe]
MKFPTNNDRKMGFVQAWVDTVMRCISTVSYFVNLNDKIGVPFYPLRGLRQGNPLSPFLFLICSEGLSSLMGLAIHEDFLKGATVGGARILKKVLKEYETHSGQCINFDKSTIIFSANTIASMRTQISSKLGMRCSTNPEKYLGLPNIVGRRKKYLKGRIKQDVNNWSTCFLSQDGKEVFIKAVTQAIPTYAMGCFLLPKSLCEEMESNMAQVWWQKTHEKHETGGMGFRSFTKFNIALLAKQGLRLLTNPNSLLA